jgi:branched-chain amino acid transport system substrate-binding protein
MRRYKPALAAFVAAAIVAAGCSSSSKSASNTSNTTSGSASPAGSASGKSYTIGVLTDLTGPGSVTGDTTLQGIKAGIGVAQQEGYNIHYVVADTGTSLTQTLTADQKLVEQDHVFAVMQISVVGFAGAKYLSDAGIPVIGGDVDGQEWLTSRNMFSAFGFEDYTKVQTTNGLIIKGLGGTDFGSIGYSIEPSSYDDAKQAAASVQAAGLKAGYVNTQVPLGSTNMAPIAIAMKNAGVDSIFPVVTTQTSFALVQALRQEGVNLKAGLMATGYGGDLTGGGPGASQAAQGLYFVSAYAPVEMHTAATEKFQSALKTYAGWTQEPTLSEYMGYASIAAFVDGLKKAGSNPTRASFINTMLGITNFDADGLWNGHTVSFALANRGYIADADNCAFVVRYEGTAFHLVAGMDPICGKTIPGKSI